jgi:hypothetical protein
LEVKMKARESTEIKGFKAYDQRLKCRDYQFEIGKEYEEKQAICCQTGFHFCENPFDLFNYYSPADSKFTHVVGSGKIDRHEEDSKIACTHIKIGQEISLTELIALGHEYIIEKIDKTIEQTLAGDRSVAANTGDQSAATNTGDRSVATNTGDQSAATNTGYQSVATNTGDRSVATNAGYRSVATNAGYQSVATNTGDRSVATVSGKESIAIATGIESKAKGSLGCWLVLSEWKETKDGWHIKAVKSALVDGKKIRENTFYKLIGGKFVIDPEEVHP